MAVKRTKEFLALKPQWQLLVAEYLKDHNASRAYTAAGYEGKNPDVHGPRMVSHPEVQRAIQAEMDLVLADLAITPRKILRDLEAARIAAMGAGKFSAAVMAIERMARYVNAFPNQYRSGNGDMPFAPDFNEHNPDAPVPIDEVSRRILFLLTEATATAGEKPVEPPAAPPVTIQ